MSERRPNVVVFTYETTVDYVVDLTTGEVKEENSGSELGGVCYVALFAEGEFANEGYSEDDSDLEEDADLVEQAAALRDTAFENHTVVKSTTPKAIDRTDRDAQAIEFANQAGHVMDVDHFGENAEIEWVDGGLWITGRVFYEDVELRDYLAKG